ncbi:MAG: DUF1329 domain-containing protein [Solimonas sp.]
MTWRHAQESHRRPRGDDAANRAAPYYDSFTGGMEDDLNPRICCALGLVAGAFALPAPAKVPADQAAGLNGPTLTCMGAERAGTPGGVAEYTGKYLDRWPGMKEAQGYEPGPYAAERPLFKITAANAAQHAARLTTGQQRLLSEYPQTYWINVYPSHRDFRLPDWACEVTKQNALSAEVVDGGLGTTGTTGSIPFPFPQSGLEAAWNINHTYRPWKQAATNDVADVYGGGRIAWSRQKFSTLCMFCDPHKRGSNQDRINSYAFLAFLSPPKDKGFVSVAWAPNNFVNDAYKAWQYIPGTRRVRQAPEIGHDYPLPPAGARTVDDDYLFNGSPERYNWNIVGKKEIYVPYNNSRINDPAIKYRELLKDATVNSDLVRYELHRVWVIRATLKDGYRHVYKTRELYVDEDTWLAAWADNYDGRDQLWRVAFINYFYAPAAQSYARGVSVYHDLTAKSYQAGYLVNESGDGWWKFNDPAMKPEQFTPSAALTAGK